MNWVRSKFQARIESKSYDETNGLVLNDVLLPEELILLILSYTDDVTLLNCKLVCNNWNELVKSNAFWRLKLQPLHKSLKENLPWYVYYCLVHGNVFEANFLKNCNGENEFEHWKIEKNGGDKWIVENPPIGTDPLPENVPELNGQQSCFATSYQACSKSQLLDLSKTPLVKKIMHEFHPTIIASEWFAGRFDCGCKYKLSLRFWDENREQIFESEQVRFVEQWEGKKWEKVEMKCDYKKIASKIAYIEFYHEGCDSQFWAGHYGSKMAGAMIKLSYDSL